MERVHLRLDVVVDPVCAGSEGAGEEDQRNDQGRASWQHPRILDLSEDLCNVEAPLVTALARVNGLVEWPPEARRRWR